MKLIMRYCVSDGCTYSNDIVVPLEYESAEAAIVDFEDLLKQAGNDEFNFCGDTFTGYDFTGVHGCGLPEFLTIDEWYFKYGLVQKTKEML